MYAHPKDAMSHFWDLIRMSLGFGPETLSEPTELMAHWQHADLVLSQTCGLPFRAVLHDRVQLVGTPDYGVPDCPAGFYNSVILSRTPDTIGATLAYNDPLSQSGWAAIYGYCTAHDITVPRPVLETGGHVKSVFAVANGHADTCAIDAVTYRLLQQSGQLPEGLHEVARTAPTPGLPYITALRFNPGEIAQAVDQALHDMPAKVRETLGIKGLARIPAQTYLAQPIPPSPSG